MNRHIPYLVTKPVETGSARKTELLTQNKLDTLQRLGALPTSLVLGDTTEHANSSKSLCKIIFQSKSHKKLAGIYYRIGCLNGGELCPSPSKLPETARGQGHCQ